MASLSDQIDRFARSSKAVNTIAANTAPARALAGPFTRAVLDTHLGDLIRDVDPSELGLFQLIGPSHPSGTEKDPSRPQVARVEFGNATPLRRTIHRRDDHVEPEICAQAAIKYIDRYDPIRPMPRARSQAFAILQRLNDVRQNIRALLQSLERIQSEEVPPLKSLIEREEERTSKIKANIADLQQRKEIALARRRPVREKTTLQIEQKATELDPRLDLEPELSPVAAAKTLHFTDNLMDEVMDLSHISNISMVTHSLDPSFNEGGSYRSNADQTMICQVEDGRADEQQDDTEMFDNAATNGPEDFDDPRPSDSSLPAATKKPSNSTNKVQINEDIERITMKLWRSAPEIIGPIHQLTSGSTVEPSSAREILTRLRLLSQSHIPPASPSMATETSLSTTTPAPPSPQQILTAHLLLTLLLAPHCALPLNKVKEELTTRASGSGGQSTSRIIYGCVAKRLVKIDRSGREQIVKFDI